MSESKCPGCGANFTSAGGWFKRLLDLIWPPMTCERCGHHGRVQFRLHERERGEHIVEREFPTATCRKCDREIREQP